MQTVGTNCRSLSHDKRQTRLRRYRLILPVLMCENRSKTTCSRFHRLHSESNLACGSGLSHTLSKEKNSLTLLLQNHLDHFNNLLLDLWTRKCIRRLRPSELGKDCWADIPGETQQKNNSGHAHLQRSTTAPSPRRRPAATLKPDHDRNRLPRDREHRRLSCEIHKACLLQTSSSCAAPTRG